MSKTTRTRKNVVITTIVAVILLILSPAIWFGYARIYPLIAYPAPDAVMQKNENLSGEKRDADLSKVKDDINLREHPSSGFMVKFLDNPTIFHYDPAMKTIKQASRQDWDNARVEKSCFEKFVDSYTSLYVDISRQSFRDTAKGISLNYYGEYPLSVETSPKQNAAAVLSAAGPKTLQLPGLPGLGGSGGDILGKRFVAVMDTATNKYITRPAALTTVSEHPTPVLCWLDNQKFLIAYEVDYEADRVLSFSVIESGL